MLIERHHLLDTIVPEDDSLLVEEEIKHERHSSMYPAASFQLIIAMGIGTVLSKLLSLTGMTFPIYIGAMIAAACIRNLGEYGGKFTVYMGEINDIGGICLSLFLGMAMITLKIWQLAELALPLVVLLAGQTLFMILYSFAIVYNVMGRDYDAAVIVSAPAASAWVPPPTPWPTCRPCATSIPLPSRPICSSRWWAVCSRISSTALSLRYSSTLSDPVLNFRCALHTGKGASSCR